MNPAVLAYQFQAHLGIFVHPGVTLRQLQVFLSGNLHCILAERCFACRAAFFCDKEVPPMDTQTVIALCAIFTVVIGIVGLANRN